MSHRTSGPSPRPSIAGLCKQNRVYREHRAGEVALLRPASCRSQAAGRAASSGRSPEETCRASFHGSSTTRKGGCSGSTWPRRGPLEAAQRVGAIMNRIGVAIVGFNGAVASTVVAGVELMKRGPGAARLGWSPNAPTRGLPSHHGAARLPPLESLVFGGWDLQYSNCYEGALHHGVLPPDVFDRSARTWSRCVHGPRSSRRYGRTSGGEFGASRDSSRTRSHHQTRMEEFRKRKGSIASSWSIRVHRPYLDVRPCTATLRRSNRIHEPAIVITPRCGTSTRRTGLRFRTATSRRVAHERSGAGRARTQTDNPFRDGRQDGQTLVKTALARCFACGGFSSMAGTRRTFWATATASSSEAPVCEQDQGARESSVLDWIVGSTRKSPVAHPLLQAARRLERSLGQHRPHRFCGDADADEGQLPLPGSALAAPPGHRSRSSDGRR